MSRKTKFLSAFELPRAAEPERGWPTALPLIVAFCVLVVVTRLFCKDSLGNASFWPANGALVAIMLLLPRRIALCSIIFCLAFNIFANAFASLALHDNVLFSTLNVVVSLIAAVLARRFCGAATDLARTTRLAAFVAASLFAAGVEAGLGEPLKRLAGEPSANLGDWLHWTLCDSLGLILATPAIMLLVKRRRYASEFQSGALERFVLVAAAMIFALISFSMSNSPELFFVYPLLVLVAFRAGPVWVLSSVGGIAIVASAFTAHGLGPLAKTYSAFLRSDIVQPFLISLIAVAVPANNVLSELNRAADRFRRLHRLARKAQAEAVMANAAKSDFIANISHEIRTPLNGVLGMVQALSASQLSSEQRRQLDVIGSSGEVLLGLLNDVLDLSKIEAGKLELEHTEFSVLEICSSVHATFSSVAERKSVALINHCEVAPNIVHVGDPGRVRQILTNLVSNAVKFTEAGAVTVRVFQGEGGLTLEVEDTGIGIPLDRINKLFMKFEQADRSTTRRFGGTGLGLSISHDLAQLMKGSVVARSELGVGSIFTVVLPLETRVVDQTTPFTAETEGPATKNEEASRLRLLAAEDNPTNQLVLKTLLAQVGIEPVMVDDGAKAVDAWKAAAFDMILMDMQMPVMDGLTAAATIRSLEAALGRRRTPIIAFTANVMSHQIKTYTDAGIDGVVAKPVEFEKLIGVMEKALEIDDRAEENIRSDALVA